MRIDDPYAGIEIQEGDFIRCTMNHFICGVVIGDGTIGRNRAELPVWKISAPREDDMDDMDHFELIPKNHAELIAPGDDHLREIWEAREKEIVQVSANQVNYGSGKIELIVNNKFDKYPDFESILLTAKSYLHDLEDLWRARGSDPNDPVNEMCNYLFNELIPELNKVTPRYSPNGHPVVTVLVGKQDPKPEVNQAASKKRGRPKKVR